MPASRRDKKPKLDKSKTPKLTAPLSVLTKDMSVPLKDMDQWVNRSIDVRKQEVEKRNGYVTRPMNSFMLYRSAYADRTKQWCLKNNHQVVSSVSGESWPMEPQEVRDQFNEWARIERANHAAAHPNYKFSPSKASSAKKRKGEETDDEDESIDLNDPDGEYRGTRSVRQRKQQLQPETTYFAGGDDYDYSPYYDQQHATTQYPFVVTPRPLPSSVSLDPYAMQLSSHNGNHAHFAVQAPSHHQQSPEMYVPRVASPQSLGGYGLPGTQSNEIFSGSRDEASMQPYTQYGQQNHAFGNVHRMPASFPPTSQSLLDSQHSLQHSVYPLHSVDPALEAMLVGSTTAQMQAAAPVESHFDSAFGDIGPEYMYADQHTNADTTLAPAWYPAEALR